jgi:uncharacterized repeat protein (TIGR03987 family)
MNSLLVAGSIIVTLALAFYSIGILSEQVQKKITKRILLFLTAGIVSDFAATILMILGSTNSPFTFHGFIGYSALLVMVIDASLIWRSYLKNGPGSTPTRSLHLYSRYAYSWWVIVYITGGLLVILK